MTNNNLKNEFVSSLRFALPIVLTQFGFLGFSIIDLYMVSRIDLVAIGGLGSANSLFWPIFTAFMGVVFAIDALASQMHGAKNERSLDTLLVQGLWLATILSVFVLMVFFTVYYHFETIVENPKLITYSKSYFFIVILSAPFLLTFTVFQRYWQAQGVTKQILLIVLLANVVNFIANEILIFGRLGFPKMGILGAATSTTISRFFMLIFVIFFTYRKMSKGNAPISKAIDMSTIKNMFSLGVPIGLMLLFEVSVFSIATQFTTRISAEATSVHQIGIVLISIFYTIPMGMASAASYRVGYFVGKNDLQQAKRVGSIIIICCAIVMTLIAIWLYCSAAFILSLFTKEPQIITMGVPILFWIAMVLTFDGIQCTVAGCLRGGSRTQMSSFATFACHYALGLPLAYYLCFISQKGLEGLWVGLASGLVALAVILFSYWILGRVIN